VNGANEARLPHVVFERRTNFGDQVRKIRFDHKRAWPE